MHKPTSYESLRDSALRFACSCLFILFLVALSALGQIMTGTM
jgi:hypothetical protein